MDMPACPLGSLPAGIKNLLCSLVQEHQNCKADFYLFYLLFIPYPDDRIQSDLAVLL